MDPYKPPVATVADAPAGPPPRLSSWRILRDVAILWVLTAVGGFAIGLTIGRTAPNPATVAMYIAGSNIVLGIIGFVISGSLARGPRWPHLAIVALGLWATSLINVFFMGFSLGQWLLGGFMIALMMGMGGGLSYVFKRSDPASG